MRLGTPVDDLSSRGKRFPKDSLRNAGTSSVLPLGISPRSSALLVITLGLATFFLPLVTADPAVLEVSHWSLFDIVGQMYAGKLPAPACERCGEPIVRALAALPASVAGIYLPMLVALVPLSIPYAINILAAISAFGFAGSLCITPHGVGSDFEHTFYGRPSDVRHVHFGWLQLALLAVMGALLLIARSGDRARVAGTGARESA